MEVPMRLVARLASLAVVAALAAAALAAPANAVTATLSYYNGPCTDAYGVRHDFTMVVSGQMGWWPPKRIEVRLWGDDEWSDDLRVGPLSYTYDLYGADWYWVSFCADRGNLNEDWDGRDELYAGVRIYDLATGYQKEKVESNRLYGYF
jgi:hypothetical protein